MAKLNLRLSFSPLHVLSNVLFSRILVWSFIAVLYCHIFSSRGTDLVDVRPWLSQQHCLQSWFRPGSIVQSGPPHPIERRVCRRWFLFAGDYIRSMEKLCDEGVLWIVVVFGKVRSLFIHVPPYCFIDFTDLHTETAWVGIPVSFLKKSCTQIKSTFYFARLMLLVVLSRIWCRAAIFKEDICGSFVPCVSLSVLQQLMMYMDSWYWNAKRATGQCQAW